MYCISWMWCSLFIVSFLRASSKDGAFLSPLNPPEGGRLKPPNPQRGNLECANYQFPNPLASDKSGQVPDESEQVSEGGREVLDLLQNTDFFSR